MRLIDKDALKTELDAWARIIRKPNCYSREDALHIIDTAPEVNAVPVVRGRWIQSPNVSECVVCSECMSDGLSAQVIAPAPPWYKYCPNCGAKMEDKPCG